MLAVLRFLATVFCLATIAPFAATAADLNWPAWRGPLGTGVAPHTGVPTTWSAENRAPRGGQFDAHRLEGPNLPNQCQRRWLAAVADLLRARRRQAVVAARHEL
jgi:hypothetical protein